jgi:hypothetical protein
MKKARNIVFRALRTYERQLPAVMAMMMTTMMHRGVCRNDSSRKYGERNDSKN